MDLSFKNRIKHLDVFPQRPLAALITGQELTLQ